MSKTVSILFLYWCTAVAVFLSVSGIITSQSSEGLIFQFFFLPITLYFVVSAIRNLKSQTLDVNLSGRKTTIIVFLVIFLFLTALAVKNILAARTPIGEQNKSPESGEGTSNSIKDDSLIFGQEKPAE
jgi:hypothetical protein